MADIAGIYRDLFGREPDADGLAYWQGKAPGITATGGDAALRAQIGGTAAIADQQAMMSRAATPSTTGYQIADIYQQEFGRGPDAEGFAYWSGLAPQIMANGGLPVLRQQIIDAAAPADAAYNRVRQMAPGATNLTQAEAADWSDYMTRATSQQRGMNNAPGVFSNYAGLAAATPEEAQAMLYRTPEQQRELMASLQGMWSLEAPNADGLNTESGDTPVFRNPAQEEFYTRYGFGGL